MILVNQKRLNFMEIIFGTHNPSKLKLYQTFFSKYNITVLGLKDIDCNIDVEEDGTTPHDNAILKAKAYAKALNKIVVADDSGLYFDNIPASLQPGSFIRRVNGRVLSDDEIITHYTALVEKYGTISNDMYDSYTGEYKKLVGRYIKSVAICIGEHTYSCDYDVTKYFLNKAMPILNPGFPMDSMSITPKFNKLTLNLTKEENATLIAEENKPVTDAIAEWVKIINK